MNNHPPFAPLENSPEMNRLIDLAIAEDLGTGDITSEACIPPEQKGQGVIFFKQEGVLCGLDVARTVLERICPDAVFEPLAQEGDWLESRAKVARLQGSLAAILSAERLMLNFMQRLSGIATLTRLYVKILEEQGSAIKVADTRKTTPLWRPLEKYAVRVGGGINHRYALYDMYLIKNNHIDAAGSVQKALRGVHAHNQGKGFPVAVEARDLNEVEAILEEGADLILLDNMPPGLILQAIERIGDRAKTEITGGLTPENLSEYADLKVDRISVGALTHSAPSLDISLHLQQEG